MQHYCYCQNNGHHDGTQWTPLKVNTVCRPVGVHQGMDSAIHHICAPLTEQKNGIDKADVNGAL